MEMENGIGGKIGTFKAQAYLDGEEPLTGAELNRLYTGLLNTRNYLNGTGNSGIVDSDDFRKLMTDLENKGAKAIGNKAEVVPGIELYTDF